MDNESIIFDLSQPRLVPHLNDHFDWRMEMRGDYVKVEVPTPIERDETYGWRGPSVSMCTPEELNAFIAERVERFNLIDPHLRIGYTPSQEMAVILVGWRKATDEEIAARDKHLEARRLNEIEQEATIKARRYQQFLALKAEFEPE